MVDGLCPPPLLAAFRQPPVRKKAPPETLWVITLQKRLGALPQSPEFVAGMRIPGVWSWPPMATRTDSAEEPFPSSTFSLNRRGKDSPGGWRASANRGAWAKLSINKRQPLGRHRLNVADWLAQLQGRNLGPPKLGAEPQFLLSCNYPRIVRRSRFLRDSSFSI